MWRTTARLTAVYNRTWCLIATWVRLLLKRYWDSVRMVQVMRTVPPLEGQSKSSKGTEASPGKSFCPGSGAKYKNW